jgi:phage gp45-like
VIEDSVIYNNQLHGIGINQTNGNFINNCQSYNNSEDGIYINGKNNNINNTQTYNNSKY